LTPDEVKWYVKIYGQLVDRPRQHSMLNSSSVTLTQTVLESELAGKEVAYYCAYNFPVSPFPTNSNC